MVSKAFFKVDKNYTNNKAIANFDGPCSYS